ncbi:hypothetical protein MIR68_001077 [Amoeboaphelidium protococcarum]|nr:hypothetical protein MIR68_001077 [Amoeboaphelidium protococcarum]
MDQFDAFSDNTQSNQNTLQSGAGGEFDPDAAMNDFLKREQETFGTAGTDDFFGGDVAGVSNDNNNTLLSPDNQTASSNRNSFGGVAGSNGFDSVNMMSSAASEPAQQRKESAAVLSVRAEQPTSASSFDNAALSRKESMVSNSNSINSNYQQQQQQPQQNRPMSATVSPTSAQTPREDTQAVKEWRAKQDKKIQARDEQMKKKHEETIQKACLEIDKFYEEYNQQKSKAIAVNRESEQTFLRVRDETKVNEGINVWEKVCNQIDFNAPSSGSLKKDTAPLSAGVGKSAQSGGRAGSSTAGGSGGNQNSSSNADVQVKRDTARFKAILSQLKNDSQAPGNVAVKANN